MADEDVALLDMDGTLADYDGAMRYEMLKLLAPGESFSDSEAPHLQARRSLIKNREGFWLSLDELKNGFRLLDEAKAADFRIVILTKGPAYAANAWTEKFQWCQEHVPHANVMIVQDKSLVYGKVLVDDWPEYMEGWLKRRPRGVGIMPEQPWNKGFKHPNVIVWDGKEEGLPEIRERLLWAKQRLPGV